MLAIAAQSIVPVAAQKSTKTRALSQEQRIVHVLNRLGFGARPGDVERVKAMGLERYINQQLNPEKIADTVAENKIKDLTVLNMPAAELYAKYPHYSKEAALSPSDSVIIEVTPTHVFERGF